MSQSSKLRPAFDSAEQIIAYAKQKAGNHKYYKHYASLERIKDNIIDGKSLYLSRGDFWNDRKDAARLNHDGSSTVNYAMCFSTGQAENVAMWMLYGGILGQGGMIDFTKENMQQILKTPTVELGNFAEDTFVPLQSLTHDQFDIYLADIIYYSEDSSGYRLTRAEEHVSSISQEIIDGLTMYLKKYAWSYERECRLIVSIDRSLVQDDFKHIKIDLSAIDMTKRLYMAPNRKAPPVQEFQSSALGSDIHWNLCRDCICRNCGCQECPI